MNIKIIDWITRILPFALLFAGSASFIGAILLQNITIALYCVILGIPTFAAAFFVLKAQKQDSDFTGSFDIFSFNQRFLIKIFIIIFFTGYIVTVLSSIKSTLFLILIVFLYCIILVQIFSKNPSPSIIITETVVTLIILIYTTTLTVPYYFGYTDIIPHTTIATITSLTGHIISPALSDYSNFPLYHIWIASSSLITGFDSYRTLIILTCPVYAVSVIFVYFIFNRIINNQQIALLTCLIYSSFALVEFFGTYVVTRTMASIGFLILLYLLYNSNFAEIETRRFVFKILAIIISLYIILVHQVSTPMILLILVVLWLCEWAVAQRMYIKTNFTLVIMSIFLGYWLFFSYSFTSNLIFTRLNPGKFETLSFLSGSLPTTPFFTSYVFFINNIHMLIFIFFGISGIFYTLWRKKPEYASVFGLFALLTILLYIPSPLQLIWQLKIFLNFNRIVLLIIPFMALIMAWGFWWVVKFLEQRKISARIICLFIVASFFIYACSSVGLINYTEKTSTRVSFNSDDLIGYNFVGKYIPSDKPLISDYYTTRYFSRNPEYAANGSENDPTGLFLLKDHYFIIPQKHFLTEGLLFSWGLETDPNAGTYSYFPTPENIKNLQFELYPDDHIYSSSYIEIYNN
jgi:hypothetical protein